MGEGVKGKVGPVLSGGSGPERRERQSGPWVTAGEDPVVGGMLMQ